MSLRSRRRPAHRRPSPRRLGVQLESLEPRRLLALGDPLTIIDTPTAHIQAGGRAGTSLALQNTIGVPLHDVHKDGQVYVDAGRVSYDGKSIDNPQPHDGDQFGYAVTEGNAVGRAASAPFDDTGAIDSGVVYFGSNNNINNKILNPFPAANGHFGIAIAAADRYLFVSVESPGNAPDSGGAVYIFDSRQGYALVGTIANPTPAAGDEFGKSIRVSDNRLVIGAPGDDAQGENSGAAYVYDLSGNLLHTLAQPDAQAGDRFGFSVFVGRTAESDTVTPIVVGAPGRDVAGQSDVGRAYTFDRVSGAFKHILDNPSPDADDQFGYSVLMAHSDNRVRVGAPFDDQGATNAGQVFSFIKLTGELIGSEANPTPAPDDLFGYALADFGQAGAPGADEANAVDSGAVYFAGSATPRLPYDIAPRGRFANQTAADGSSYFVTEPFLKQMSMMGNEGDIGLVHQFDADSGDLVHSYPAPLLNRSYQIAAANNRLAITQWAGSERVHVYDTQTHELLYHILPPHEVTLDLPQQIAMDGDLLFLSVGKEYGGYHGGAVLVYDAATGQLLRTIDNPAYENNSYFGVAVVANNGLVAVASSYGLYGGDGTTYVFRASDGQQMSSFHTPGASTLAIGDGKVVVGSPDRPVAITDEGVITPTSEVNVYRATTGALEYAVNVPDPGWGFGKSLSISGDTLLIGEPSKGDDGYTDPPSRVHIVYLPTGVVLHTITSTADSFAGEVLAFGGKALVSDDLALGPNYGLGRLYRYDAVASGIYLLGTSKPTWFVENNTPVPLSPNATFTNPTHVSFLDGTLKATITNPKNGDRLGMIHRGVGSGQIGINDAEILYAGSPIATFALNEDKTEIVITFTASPGDHMVQAILRHISFENPLDDFIGGSRTIAMSMGTEDGAHSATSDQILKAVSRNDAPVLDNSPVLTLPDIAEDELHAGVSLDALLGGVTDADAQPLGGIAIVGADSANGTWQVISDDNPGWWRTVHDPAENHAFLLRAGVNSKIRFVPHENHNGTATVQFRAWDQTGGYSYTMSPVNISGYTGGETPFSVASDSVAVTITPMNDAPVLNNSLSPELTSTTEDSSTPSATLVSSVLTGAVTDPDQGARRGIAIGTTSDYHGVWEYRLNNYVEWLPVGEVSESAALLLPGWASLRFIPKSDFNGTVKLYYRAWDQTQGSPGERFNLFGKTGGANAFSVAKEGASLTVTPVNDPPKLSLSGSIGYKRNASPITLAPFATVTDVDSANLYSGQLRVWITDGASTSNRLIIGSGFSVDANNNVLQGSTIIGKRTSSGFGTSDLIVAFNYRVTPTIAQQLARAITFQTKDGPAGQRTILFTLSDGDGGLSDEATKLVNVT